MSKVTEKLKQLQADSLALFVKLHNYHWNIKGVHFHPIHNMTEAMYNEMAEIYDDTAERLLQLGQKPYITMSEIAKATTIGEETKSDFDAKYVVTEILKVQEQFLKAFRDLSDAADEAGDKATIGYADEKIASLEKSIWMNKAILA